MTTIPEIVKAFSLGRQSSITCPEDQVTEIQRALEAHGIKAELAKLQLTCTHGVLLVLSRINDGYGVQTPTAQEQAMAFQEQQV